MDDDALPLESIPEHPKDVQTVCPECRELLEVSDIEGFVRSVHIQNACPATDSLFPH